jgi:hypothetical protein
MTSGAGLRQDLHTEAPLLREVYPDLSAELVSLLDAEELTDLAACARDLRIIARCSCGDGFCQSLHTAPVTPGPYGPGHRCVPLLPKRGMLNLDVVHGRIVFVEILDRPPLRDESAGA